MMPGVGFHSPAFGRERLDARRSIPRHRHRHGYITIVLAGSYQEAGFDGRRNLVAGDVVVHRAYDAHLDHVGIAGTELLNLPLAGGSPLPTAFRVADPDVLARLAEIDPEMAAAQLSPAGVVISADDWPDRLALVLLEHPDLRLHDWADGAGLAPETLSRGFRAAYGISPARFRIEARVRRAMALIEQEGDSLASIAADCGFADQPHLTRAVVKLTGRTPGHWRSASIPFKKGGRGPA